MSASIHSPQPPLQRGVGGMDWRTHTILILLIQYSFGISDENRMSATIQSHQPPLQRRLGGMDCCTHSTIISDSEWVLNDTEYINIYRGSIPPNPLCRGGWGDWIVAHILFSSEILNEYWMSRMSMEWVRQSIPPNPLCRGGWGEWIVALILHSFQIVNEYWMMKKQWNEGGMRRKKI